MRVSALLMSSALFCMPAAAAPALQPFVVDHENHAQSPLDVSFLLEKNAGDRGFIRIKDGHLVHADGQRFRCWGVNLGGWTPGSALLPPKASADVYARTLARLGINCVRLHFLDLPNKPMPVHGQGGATPNGEPAKEPFSYRPAGLIDSSRSDTKSFDPEQLDRLDYMVYRLKSLGIYVDLNLNVGRSYLSGDGVPDHDLIGVAKGFTYFGPELIARQKEYARALIKHVNPYTKTAYSDEPAVAVVEIVNENSLTEFWMRNWLRGENEKDAPRLQLDLTPHYKALLTAQYNDWLRRTYKPAQLEKMRQTWGIPAGQPVELLRRGDFSAAPADRFHAEAEFLAHVETAFFTDMSDYLRKDLGVKVPIIPTADHTYFISGLPLLRSTSRLEVQDAHTYWQHPAIYGRRATPMLDDPQHSMIVKLARTAMAGKPFTVSEINEPFPNDYGSEMIPVIASYAAFQDWDAVFFYSMEPKLNGLWKPTIGDFFDIAQDPVKIAEIPLGALTFLRHDVQAARKVVARSYSTSEVDETARAPANTKPYFTPDFPLTLPLQHGSRIRCLDCEPLEKISLPNGDDILSDTGELRWHAAGEHTGFLTTKSERTEIISGFTAEASRKNGNTPHLGTDITNEFATVALSSLDGKALSGADRMMLVAVAYSRNSGSAWDSRKAMMAKWGDAPTLIEPVTGWILLKNLDGAVKVTVTPIDGAGRPLAPIDARMLEDGWEFAVGTPAATNYLVSVTR
jgi:hypothetical protein